MVLLFKELPLEILFKIFELCEIKDLFQIRLVCKQFNLIVSQIKIDELVFYGGLYVHGNKWYASNRTTNCAIRLQNPSKLNLLNSSILNLKNLKRLMIRFSVNFKEFKIEHLNKFTKLEQLEIAEYNPNEEKLLSLPQLKVICLHTIYSNGLTIEAPKLETVLCKIGLDLINFKNNETIKQLEIYSFKDKVFTFKNLEKLELDYTTSSIDDILFKLPKLNEIKFNLTDYVAEIFEILIDTMRNLLNEKNRLNRDEVKIYFKNKLIIDENVLNRLDPDDYFDDFDDDVTDSETDGSDLYLYSDCYERDYFSDVYDDNGDYDDYDYF